jgi:alginate O-acetyltransferase complex protein AlgI
MLFNSYIFIFIFLPTTLLIYFYLNKRRLTVLSKFFLVASSLFFYGWWNVIYLPLIIFSILINYAIGSIFYREISKIKKYRRLLLLFGVFLNLSLLGYFKYTNFLIENINMFSSLNMQPLNLVLPLAISFFTFQQITYLVDSYYSKIDEHSLLNYANFVLFFPQLIAGPIVHHKEMMPQFSSIKNKLINYKNIFLGIFIFSIGLFKKVVIADTFSIWATNGFDIEESLTFIEAWVTSLSYTFQLYFDFSGYADMAIGAALLFNIRLPLNFNSPYKSLNIQEFWRRWHMTLSRLLKDYVYIPLGGNRCSNFRIYINLIITFIIGGIWHGAGWTFIVWGTLHGVAIVLNRIWQKLNINIGKIAAWFITFNFINITWIFFRAKEWNDAIKVLFGMFSVSTDIGSINLISVLFIVLAIIVTIFFKNTNELEKKIKIGFVASLGVSFVLFISITVLLIRRSSEFLYFQF